ncbi:hypothetical protein [Speluncibacter jeojiensis]|uniref:Secreted protein n=1 Tax=Speluncibacter jeojiensis TaxID=2710754 RepID=A0A9X4M1E9_9ACTN|nr:hypothetical protein [Corynebacteriales bacterium D3-21]
MLRIRGTKRTVAAVAIASAAALVAPAVASADQPHTPPPAPRPAAPAAPSPEQLTLLQAFAPAIIGAAADTSDPSGAPNSQILGQAKNLLDNSNLPKDIKDKLGQVITFLDGSGGGGPKIPQPTDPHAPVIQQFLFPTIGKNCIGGTSDAVGTALMTGGPQAAPKPGPGPHQAGYVFTALGTSGAQPNPAQPLNVSWVNLDTHASGIQALTNEAGINKDGPTTLSTVVNTGSGRIISTVYGSITSKGTDGQAPVTCSILPTVGIGVVK